MWVLQNTTDYLFYYDKADMVEPGWLSQGGLRHGMAVLVSSVVV